MPADARRYAFQPIGTAPPEPGWNGGAQRSRAGPTDADVAAAREQGFEAGRREAAAQTERATSEALRAIARMLQMILSGLGQEAQNLRTDAVEVALAATRLAAGAALDRFAAEAVAGFFSEAIGHLRDVPRLVVRVPPDLLEAIEPLLVRTALDAGFDGHLVVRPDPDARPGDCTLEWADGQIHHDRQATLAAIEDAAGRWLEAAAAEGVQLDLFSP